MVILLDSAEIGYSKGIVSLAYLHLSAIQYIFFWNFHQKKIIG